jgi:hypothetical protein
MDTSNWQHWRSLKEKGWPSPSGRKDTTWPVPLLYLRLLQQQIGFTRDNNTNNIIICDNQGLLTRIEETTQWSYMPPNVTLRAEWDIESVILQTYQEPAINFMFLHVKSHQDNGPVANLSLGTRLNVEADRLATEYLQSAAPPSTNSTTLPYRLMSIDR